jgi:hypothetical protein
VLSSLSQRNDERISTGSQYIPQLPKAVDAYPTFWVIRKEVEEFLYPLYARGWGVGFYARRHYTARNVRSICCPPFLIHNLPLRIAT